MRLCSSFCFLALATVGCKDPAPSKPKEAPSATASAPTSASCAKQAEDLGAWLKAVNDEGMGPPPPYQQMGMKLVPRNDGDPWAWFGAAMLVDKGAVQLDFDKLGAPSDSATLEKLVEQLKQRAGVALAAGISMGLDVYIHKDTPWEMVVAVFDPAVASGFRTVGVVFEGPSKIEAPSSSLLAALDAADQKRREDGDPLDDIAPAGPADKAFAKCRPAISVLREAGKRELTPKEKNEFFVKRAPGAWLSCQCRADQDAIRAVQWHWLGRTYGPPTRSVKLLLTSADDKEATKVSGAKTEPWSKMADKVVEASKSGKRVALTVE